MKKLSFIFIFTVITILIWGCTTAQKGAVVGGAGGATLGGIIGHQSGHGKEGALIGAGVGAVTGALIGEKMETKFCPVCGAEYTSGAQYCSKDGTELKLKQK